MPDLSRSLRFFLLVCCLAACAWHGRAVTAAAADVPAMEAAPPAWLEQRQDAASFASDWLTDLDMEDFAAAAEYFTVDGDREKGQAALRELRAGLGKTTSRAFGGAAVVAVAADDSEHKVSVTYTSEFAEKTVVETVLVLLRHGDPAILRYSVTEQ